MTEKKPNYCVDCKFNREIVSLYSTNTNIDVFSIQKCSITGNTIKTEEDSVIVLCKHYVRKWWRFWVTK